MIITKTTPPVVTPPSSYQLTLNQDELNTLTIVLGACAGWNTKNHPLTYRMRALMLDFCTINMDERLECYTGSIIFKK